MNMDAEHQKGNTMSDTQLIARWQHIQEKIHLSAIEHQRNPKDIKLIAVSKFHSVEAIRTLANAGQKSFGENYVQEMTEKAKMLTDLTIDWHFIGPLQSNKCQWVAETASMMHSLDRLKLVAPLARYRPSAQPPLKLLLQVNVDHEQSKTGTTDFESLYQLAQAVMAQERLSLQGLMAIPAISHDSTTQRIAFKKVRLLRDKLANKLNTHLPELSMGMSADFDAAIAEGATIVRIGTDIFGQRITPST